MKYKGDLEDFPERVVNWMLDQQEKQGNKRDVSVFEDDYYSGLDIGGFYWYNESDARIIASKDFDLFDKLYPEYSFNYSDLLTELLNKQQEIISNSLRFNAVTIEDIKQVFAKHGIGYVDPF